MEKLLKQYDKEYMKMAMLKHEETFREQVYELHRLYRIQKRLMRNIESSRPNGQNQDRWNSKNRTTLNQQPRQNLDLERPAEDSDGVLEIDEESQIELTLGPTSQYRRRKAVAETPLTSESGPSFSSSSSGSSYIKRTSSRPHQRTNNPTEESFMHKWGMVQVPDPTPGFLSSGGKKSSDVEEKLRQDRLNQPAPRILQVLSLKMT